ncbi:MAG: DUF4367 domain-containing protein, partial [Roseburia sp.]|nr:DUF4367 domain-containing protein [Roseburia sp.]
DHIAQTLKEGLQNEAEAIREEIRNADIEDISDEQKEAIQKKLQAKIAQYETEFSDELTNMDIYAKLSKEDREALELGRKMRERQKRVRKKRSRKLYFALAAAIVLVLAIGMTSMGGAERIVSVVKQAIGGREVTKITSDENNMVLENENEEKAYQEIKDAFGVEPAKFIRTSKKMQFIQMDLDKNLQTAELLYKYNTENLIYIINANYMDSSFGIDVEDQVIKKDIININGYDITLVVYKLEEKESIRCLANFTYHGLECFLTGTISEKEFRTILNNLYLF